MSAIALVAARELRRRGLHVLVLMLFVGVIGMCSMAAAAGARRSSTALARFKTSSRSADLELQGSPTARQLEQLASIDGVAAIGVLQAYAVVIPAVPDFQEIGEPLDAQFGHVVDRDRIIAGRALDPIAPDEVTIGEGLATRLHLRVGDDLGAEAYSPKQVAGILAGAGDVGARSGPPLHLRVVGIVRRPLDLGDRGASGGLVVLSPAFTRAYSGRIGIFGERIRIRTDHGAGDVAGVLATSRRILGPRLFGSQSLAVDVQGASNAIDVVTLGLWIAAAVAAMAGAFAIGIVLSREIASVTSEHETLKDLGCTRSQRVAVAAPSTALIALGGAIVAVVGAIAMSALFPLGVARRADPMIGVHADIVVLLAGVVAVVFVVGLVALLAAFRATRQSTLERTRALAAKPSAIVATAAAAGLAPSIMNGLRMAVEPGRGKSRIPVRSAFLGAIAGVVGVTGTLVFASSLEHLTTSPASYGETWQFKVPDVTANTACGGSDYGLRSIPGIAALAEVCAQTVQIERRPTGAIAYTQVRGDAIGPEIVAGLAPSSDRDVALGAKTLQQLGKHIGDRVRVAGRTATQEYKIVGRAVFPTLGASQPIGDGAAFTGAGYAHVFDQNIFLRYFVGRYAVGADRNTVRRRIDEIPQLATPTGTTVPAEIDRLHQVRWLPLSLALLLGGLAVFAVGHGLVASVHRRRRELGLLKALGFERRQVRATIGWQATTIGAVGVMLGIPAGVLVGAFAWRRVADGLGVATHLAVPALGLTLIAAGALAVVNLLAFVPARNAARTRPSVALHAE